MNTSEKLMFYLGALLASVAMLIYAFHLQPDDKLIIPLMLGTVFLANGQRRYLMRLKQRNQELEARL